MVAKNKILTRDNLLKRQSVPDVPCLFCAEPENCHHLFFECVVSIECWRVILEITGCDVELDLRSLVHRWSTNVARAADIMLHAAALWALWKHRNDICFNRAGWSGMQVLWIKTASHLAAWEVLCSDLAKKGRVAELVRKMEQLARDPPMLLWPDPG